MPTPDRLYLDYNATAPLRDNARAAMSAALDLPTNASSVHHEGRRARALIEEARRTVARCLNAAPAAVTFTSGASEANALALSPIMRIGAQDIKIDRLLVSAAAHPSLLSGGQFAASQVERLAVDENGLIDRAALNERLKNAFRRSERCLVTTMLANNETGVIERAADIAEIVKGEAGRGAPFHFLHLDAVQAVGRIPVDLEKLGADSLSLSGHKLGGPLGVGAFVAKSEDYRPLPLISGGGQEKKLRGGTENTPAIAGFSVAISEACQEIGENLSIFTGRDFIEENFRSMFRTIIIYGGDVHRIGNTSCFSIPGTRADNLMMSLDLDGISVSSGSACSSGKVGASHVLKSMEVPDDLALAAIRLSLGRRTSQGDCERFLTALERAVQRTNPELVTVRAGAAVEP